MEGGRRGFNAADGGQRTADSGTADRQWGMAGQANLAGFKKLWPPSLQQPGQARG